MPTPTARQSHIDTALTNISIGYKNAAYIADQIFPVVPVNKISNKYFLFPNDAWFRDETAARAPGSRAKVAEYTLSTSPYVCTEKALSKLVTDEEVDNADAPLQPFVTATEWATDQLQKRLEIDVLGVVFGTGWASSATPGTLWSSDAADPLGDVETAMNAVALAIGREPNIGVIGRGLWRYLKNHPDLVDRLKYGQTPGAGARVTQDGLAGLFGLEKVLVANAVKDTGNEGAAQSIAYIGGNHMWVGYVTGAAALATPTAGYVFAYKNREVNRFRDDPAHTSLIEARASWDVRATATDAGYLIKSAA